MHSGRIYIVDFYNFRSAEKMTCAVCESKIFVMYISVLGVTGSVQCKAICVFGCM